MKKCNFAVSYFLLLNPPTLTHTHSYMYIHSVVTCGAAELFHMCRVCQIKLGLIDKGPFTHRWMSGWGVGGYRRFQSKIQPVSKPASP